MITPIEWFWVGYISIGLFIMMEAIVVSWSWEEYSKPIKIMGAIVSVLLWPLIFFT